MHFITQSTICGYNGSCWVSDIADNKNSWNITCTSLLSLLYVDIIAAVGCQIFITQSTICGYNSSCWVSDIHYSVYYMRI